MAASQRLASMAQSLALAALAWLGTGVVWAQSPALPRAVTYQDVLALIRPGTAESRILAALETSPTRYVLDAEQEAQLKQAGASQRLIESMTSGPKLSPSEPVTDLAIILDCSGSMSERTKEGQTKLAAAKQVVADLIGSLPDGLHVAFVVYGHDANLKCRAVEVVQPRAPLSEGMRSHLAGTIAAIQPAGMTPIALALKTAGAELAKSNGQCGVVLISDGKETCHGDPAAEAAMLAANLQLTFGVNVIGFGVTAQESEALAQIARQGQGRFLTAQSAAELATSLQSVRKTLEAAGVPQPLARRQEARPSSDVANPVSLELGAVVKGRVDPASRTSKAHYWLVDLPAGEYKAVLDLERADRKNSHILADLQWFGESGGDKRKLARMNEVDFRTRGVFPFRLAAPMRGILCVQAEAMMDYDLALFEATAAVPAPFFRQAPSITPIELGQAFAPPPLTGSSGQACSAYCSLTLPAGDYELTAAFRRTDGRRRNIIGSVQALSAEGMIIKTIGHVNDIEARTTKKFRLALSEEQRLLFRLVAGRSPGFASSLEATLTVERLAEAE